MRESFTYVALPSDRSSDGCIEPIVSLGGIKCPACGIWVGMRRIPVPCPRALQTLLDHYGRSVLVPEEFDEINRVWAGERPARIRPERLEPGDIFSPVEWKLDKPHGADLHWPAFSNIVSPIGVIDALRSACVTGVRAVHIRRTNASQAWAEWSFEYHTAEKVLAEFRSLCELCKYWRVEAPVAHEQEVATLEARNVLPRNSIPPADLFLSHIYYPGFIASGRAMEILMSLGLKRFLRRPLTIV
jgi:hypothetical protein